MTTIALKCDCGTVRGTAKDITPDSGNRVVCCCDDCQAFAQFLGQEASVLDEFGGTEIYQTSQSQVSITQGRDQLKSLRLTPKGLLRWYAGCCNTPIGNTMNAKMPFIGIIHNFMDISDRNTTLGPVRAYVQTQHAKGTPDYPHHSAKFPLGITARIIRKILIWKIQGKNKPTEFFKDDGRPISKPLIAENSTDQ